MPYPLSINTFPYLWKMPVDACIRHLMSRGYARFEVMLTEPHCWPLSLPREIRQQIAQRVKSKELEITSINLGGFDNNLASQAAEVRQLAVKIIASVLELAGDWGAKGIVVSPGLGRPLLPPPAGRLEQAFRSSIEQLLPVAEKTGVDLLLENIPYSFAPKADGLASVIESIGSKRIGVCYDVPNALFAREAPEDGFCRLADHIRLVHFSDTGLDVWKHDRIGQGVVDFASALKVMREIGYGGPLVLEIIDSDGDNAIDESVAAISKLDS
ncbi:MAG: sugar phosphate isomerase/epimerase [Xanthobacteraceae bacterium]|nr:sugar phosphate isomerase/epimerase [Xanthobacteraceae bacterium]